MIQHQTNNFKYYLSQLQLKAFKHRILLIILISASLLVTLIQTYKNQREAILQASNNEVQIKVLIPNRTIEMGAEIHSQDFTATKINLSYLIKIFMSSDYFTKNQQIPTTIRTMNHAELVKTYFTNNEQNPFNTSLKNYFLYNFKLNNQALYANRTLKTTDLINLDSITNNLNKIGLHKRISKNHTAIDIKVKYEGLQRRLIEEQSPVAIFNTRKSKIVAHQGNILLVNSQDPELYTADPYETVIVTVEIPNKYVNKLGNSKDLKIIISNLNSSKDSEQQKKQFRQVCKNTVQILTATNNRSYCTD